MNRYPTSLRQWAGLAAPRSVAAIKTALILIDMQEEYFSGKLPIPDGAEVAAHAARLLVWAREAGISIFHIRHEATSRESPLYTPATPMVEFHPAVTPRQEEPVIVKHLPSGFRDTGLHDRLAARGIETLIICGLMTHMCVDSTAREGLHLGYRIVIAADACASRDLPDPVGNGIIDHMTVHRTALAALGDRFADILRTDDIVRLPVEK